MQIEDINTPDEAELTGGPRPWAIAALLLTLLAFSLAGFTAAHAAEAAPAVSPAAGALQQSFEHFQAGRYQEAVTSAKAAIEADPNLAAAYNNLAVSYLKLGMFAEAEAAAHEAIRLDPENQLAKNNLAWIQQEKIEASSPGMTAKLADSAALLSQSLEHAQAGRFKECIETASQSAKLNPSSSRAFNNRGFCEGNLRNWDSAIRDLKEAIRLDANSQLAKNNLAWAQAGKLEAKPAVQGD